MEEVDSFLKLWDINFTLIYYRRECNKAMKTCMTMKLHHVIILITNCNYQKVWNPSILLLYDISQGRIQDFKLGGAHIKKIAPSGGRHENYWGISCEKSRFYAKNLLFFPIAEGGAKILGYFVWKITILRQKNHIFSNFRVRPPPGSVPVTTVVDFYVFVWCFDPL